MRYDVAIIGAGVVGSAVARDLSLRSQARIAVLEKEQEVAQHTSGRNSGVVHSGFNQESGSLKAQLCVAGNRMVREYCPARGVPLMHVGTLVVAHGSAEIETLRELERRGTINGVPGIRLIDKEELTSLEPHCAGEAALHSPTGSIVDSKALVGSLAAEAKDHGVQFFFGARVERIEDGTVIAGGQRIEVGYIINCAGLHADEIAHMMGVGLGYKIIPFRGEYYELRGQRAHLVNSMIYPAPNLGLPFLGIHFTRRTDGRVIVGPNAVLALGRESYGPWQVSPSDTLAMLTGRHFWRLVLRREFTGQAIREIRTSISKRRFVSAARRLVPEITEQDLEKGVAGIRAQLVDRRGHLVEDFVQEDTENSTHILNTVSPGLTSAMAFAEHLAPEIMRKAGLQPT
jgi:L-2-hydroxyglutarate oxidase